MGKKALFIPVFIVVGIISLGVYSWFFDQPRLTKERMEQAQEVLKQINEIKQVAQASEQSKTENKAEPAPGSENKNADAESAKTSSESSNTGYPPDAIPPEQMPETVPDTFKVRFECSNGNFVIECHKDWAPIGVEHFYNLLKVKYYDGARFFRVVPGFVVQFGLAGDPAMTAKYGNKNIKDDPVKQSNKKGMVTYAKSSLPNSRSTQLFINLADNTRLDDMGFAPFAKVIEGMDVVERINPKYGETPDQMMIRMQGNEYLDKQFPNLDYIKRAYVLKATQ